MRPRLTSKVIRGLTELGRVISAGPLPPTTSSDAGSAIIWIDGMQKWVAAPRRTGKMPAHLAKRLQARYK